MRVGGHTGWHDGEHDIEGGKVGWMAAGGGGRNAAHVASARRRVRHS